MQEAASPDRFIINVPSSPEEIWRKIDLFENEKNRKIKLYKKYSDLRLCMFKLKGLFRKKITIEMFFLPYNVGDCVLRLEVRDNMFYQLTGKKMVHYHKYLMILYTFIKKHFPEASDYTYK